jgi:hypothetical protein
VAALLVVAVGCHSWRDVPLHEMAMRVEPGDKVRATTKEGERSVFRVTQVSSTMIAGEGRSFSVTELESLERRGFSFLKTGAVVVVILGALAVATVYATVEAVEAAFGG